MDMMLKVALLACGLVLLAPGCRMSSYCASGWTHFGGSCWLVTSKSMLWFQALAHCERLGARLAIPYNEAENEFLADLIPREVGKGWLGTLCEGTRCQPIHSTGVLDFASWGYDQPDDFNGIVENCVALHGNGDWHDYPCCNNFYISAICRKH